MRTSRRGMAAIGVACAAVVAAGVAVHVRDESAPTASRADPRGRGELSAPAGTNPWPASRPVAAPAVNLPPRLSAVDPQGVADLWAHAQSLMASGRVDDLERASTALHLCTAVVDDADDRRRSFNDADAVQADPANAQRRLASDEIIRRCLGFERLGGPQRHQWMASLRERLIEAGSRFADGPHEESASLPRDTVISLLRQATAQSYEQARPALAAGMARRLGIEGGTDEQLALDAAVLLAGCDFGRDCSATSFDALRRCTYQAVCGQGLFDHWRQVVPPLHHGQVMQWRELIRRAVATQRWDELGL